MKTLDAMPLTSRNRPPAATDNFSPADLRVPQLRVLRALAALGPGLSMTRAQLSDTCGNKTGVVVGRAVGYSDPAKRAKFEQTKDGGGSPDSPCPSLLTLGYVSEHSLDLDGVTETHITLTDAGRAAELATHSVVLPDIRDPYEETRQLLESQTAIPSAQVD